MSEALFACIRAAQAGDREAAGRLVEENAGLIWSVVRRFFGRGVESDDLYQLGCLGFLKALTSFDADYGTRFSTYAVPKIAGEIRRFLRDDGSVKVSRGMKERAALVARSRRVLEQELGREPFLSELAAHTGLEPEEIAAAESAVSPARSLDYEAGEEGFSLLDSLSDPDAEARLLDHVALREGLAALPEKERRVLLLRFFRGMTQQRAAALLGVSQVQVSRLERRALEALRAYVE